MLTSKESMSLTLSVLSKYAMIADLSRCRPGAGRGLI